MAKSPKQPDPKRDSRLKVFFSADERAQLRAAAERRTTPEATLVRELVMAGLLVSDVDRRLGQVVDAAVERIVALAADRIIDRIAGSVLRAPAPSPTAGPAAVPPPLPPPHLESAPVVPIAKQRAKAKGLRKASPRKRK